MIHHHAGPGAAEEISPILPVLVGVRVDDATVEQNHPIVVSGQKADAAEPDVPHRNISGRLFKRGFGLVDSVETERTIANIIPRMEESAGQKIFRPRQPNEPRFAPQQYYYAASKSGVVASRVIFDAAHPARYDAQGADD
jgi:hypothetical protein